MALDLDIATRLRTVVATTVRLRPLSRYKATLNPGAEFNVDVRFDMPQALRESKEFWQADSEYTGRAITLDLIVQSSDRIAALNAWDQIQKELDKFERFLPDPNPEGKWTFGDGQVYSIVQQSQSFIQTATVEQPYLGRQRYVVNTADRYTILQHDTN